MKIFSKLELTRKIINIVRTIPFKLLFSIPHRKLRSKIALSSCSWISRRLNRSARLRRNSSSDSTASTSSLTTPASRVWNEQSNYSGQIASNFYLNINFLYFVYSIEYFFTSSHTEAPCDGRGLRGANGREPFGHIPRDASAARPPAHDAREQNRVRHRRAASALRPNRLRARLRRDLQRPGLQPDSRHNEQVTRLSTPFTAFN